MDINFALPIQSAKLFFQFFVKLEIIVFPTAIIVNICVIYLILRHTPPVMKTYRVHLLNMQISLIIWDFCLHFIVRPIFLSPNIAVACSGILSRIYVDCHLQLTFNYIVLINTMTSLAALLLYKQNKLAPPGSTKLSDKKMRNMYLALVIVNYAVLSFFFICGYTVDRPKLISEMFPNYQTTVAHMTAYDRQPLFIVWFSLTMGGFSLGVLSFPIHIITVVKNTRYLSKVLRSTTYDAHRVFSYVLISQSLLVVFIFMAPIIMVFICIFFQFHLNEVFLQAATTIPIALYSIIHSSMLFAFTKCYRTAAVNILKALLHIQNARPRLVKK